ncbi:MAG: Bax inhibitor-1/YccA family protein [Anaerolineae bacterium]|nr:Bax inhibitor-1/YccA family protein [Anaerolineae bacterium]
MSYESDFGQSEPLPVQISEQQLSEMFNAVMVRVYGWMTLGLFVTTVASLLTLTSPALLNFIYSSGWVYFGFLIGMFALIFAIGRSASKMASGRALALFMVFAALMGVWLSAIFIVYAADSIFFTFGLTTVIFVLLTVVGLTTKQDLTRWGPILLFSLLGLILASIVNIFFFSETLYWIITYAGVLIFMGLIAYDSQKIKKMTYAAAMSGRTEGQVISSIGVMGALTLYLDFINLFLFLLRIFGRRR